MRGERRPRIWGCVAAIPCWANLALAAGLPMPAGDVVDTIERTFKAEARPLIVLQNVDGRNRLAAGTQSQIQIRAVKEVRRAGTKEEAVQAAERVNVRIEQIGNRIEIEAIYPRRIFSFGLGTEVLVHFEIVAPRLSDIEAHSVDGPLEVMGFEGRLELSAVDGDLTVRGCAGRIKAHTVDGDLRLEEMQGEVEARTVDGDLSLDGKLKGLEAKSTDGRIDIRLNAGSAMEKDWTIRTTDGDIRVSLPEGFPANLELSTTDGRIQSDHPVTLEGAISKRRLSGKLNGGGRLLEMHSTDGDITIARP